MYGYFYSSSYMDIKLLTVYKYGDTFEAHREEYIGKRVDTIVSQT